MSGSVSAWIVGLKAGESEAVRQLWVRYSREMVRIARLKIGTGPRQAADEEDVVQNVFTTIFRGATTGRFAEVTDRDDLWWMLLALTHNKTIDQLRGENRKKRGAGKVVRESDLANGNSPFGLSQIMAKHPTPDFLVALDEEFHYLLSRLRDDPLRKIAAMRIEGWQISEIAAYLKISVRSVERKLRLIRSQWSATWDFAE
jgi:DNA-directed RNA polymerase specialized sigma24 family protein